MELVDINGRFGSGRYVNKHTYVSCTYLVDGVEGGLGVLQGVGALELEVGQEGVGRLVLRVHLVCLLWIWLDCGMLRCVVSWKVECCGVLCCGRGSGCVSHTDPRARSGHPYPIIH